MCTAKSRFPAPSWYKSGVGRTTKSLRPCHTWFHLRPYPEYSRANSYPWSPFPPEAGPSRTRSSQKGGGSQPGGGVRPRRIGSRGLLVSLHLYHTSPISGTILAQIARVYQHSLTANPREARLTSWRRGAGTSKRVSKTRCRAHSPHIRQSGPV